MRLELRIGEDMFEVEGDRIEPAVTFWLGAFLHARRPCPNESEDAALVALEAIRTGVDTMFTAVVTAVTEGEHMADMTRLHEEIAEIRGKVTALQAAVARLVAIARAHGAEAEEIAAATADLDATGEAIGAVTTEATTVADEVDQAAPNPPTA